MCSTLSGCARSRQICERLVARHLEPLERLVGLDDLGHLGLDGGKVLLAELVLQVEVVVEAVVDRRAEGQLHAVEQPHHGPGHHVGAGMPHDPPGLRGLFS